MYVVAVVKVCTKGDSILLVNYLNQGNFPSLLGIMDTIGEYTETERARGASEGIKKERPARE